MYLVASENHVTLALSVQILALRALGTLIVFCPKSTNLSLHLSQISIILLDKHT